MSARTLIAGTAALALAACATPAGPPTPPPQAVVSLAPTEGAAAKTCLAAPALDQAVSMTPPKPAAMYAATVEIGPASPCIAGPDGPSNAAVFKLPDAPGNHVITVGGQREALRTLAVRVSTLDKNGAVVRAFPADKVMDYGGTRGVQFRPSETEAYILVVTDPTAVGQALSGVESFINATTGSTYNAALGYSSTYQMLTGSETKSTRTLSHEGRAIALATALSGKVGAPEADKKEPQRR